MEKHVTHDSSSNESYFMADVRAKRPTRRRAVAVGEIHTGEEAFACIVEKRLPKGDALAMAEIAGLQGAKQASNLMPLCHPLLLDLVRVRCVPLPDKHVIRVYCEVANEARTGVEMEALAGASAALLTIYDLTKPVQPALSIEAVRLLFKEGGKKGLWCHPAGMSEEEESFYRPQSLKRLDGVASAVITLSDRAHAGVSQDLSGPILVQRLQDLGAEVESADILPDGIKPLAARLRELQAEGIKLCLCTGGTGFSQRDLTPEALLAVADRELASLADLLRVESAKHTPLAWLSRATAVQLGEMLVLALPGSPKAVQQGMDIVAPILPHALAMLADGDHE